MPLGVVPPPLNLNNNFNNPNSRAIVTGGGGNTASAAPINAGVQNAFNNVPARSMRTDAGNVIVSGNGQSGVTPTPTTPTVAQQPQLSREEVMARIEAQRQILLQKEQQGAAPSGMSRILPPTPYGAPPAPGAPR